MIPAPLLALGAVLFVVAFVGALYALTGAIGWARTTWRDYIARRAQRILDEEPLTVAALELDVIELDAIEHEAVPVPTLERLKELTQDELIDVYLATLAENVQYKVEFAAQSNEIDDLIIILTRMEKARARHLATIRRLKAENGSAT